MVRKPRRFNENSVERGSKRIDERLPVEYKELGAKLYDFFLKIKTPRLALFCGF
jgi:hypothetical protein